MNAIILRACALAAAAFVLPLAAFSATPKPIPIPTPNLPHKALHVQLIVEVNNRGQVVRVDHGTLSGDTAFDTMTLGNAMQMWIRHPNGTAQTGLYRVSYNYNPSTRNVTRVPTLIKAGGSWAHKPGAATMIINDARREVRKAEARLRAEQAKARARSEKNLPDIKAAVRRAIATPTPRP
jgi:hypothetical protein